VERARTEFPDTLAASRDLELSRASDRPVVLSQPLRVSTTVKSRVHHKIETRGELVLIRPSSFSSMFNSEEFKHAVLSSLGDGVRRVCFDFADLGEIDSLTLGTMAYFLEMAEKRGIEFYLCRANEFVKEVLNITRFDQVIRIVDTPEQVEQAAAG
jgi:anti-anti-sigma factor